MTTITATDLPTRRALLRFALTPKRWASGRRFHFDRNAYGGGWIVALAFGPGPGYCVWNEDRSGVLVHGRGLHVAWKPGQWRYEQRFGSHRERPFRKLDVGVAYRDGNRRPYMSH